MDHIFEAAVKKVLEKARESSSSDVRAYVNNLGCSPKEFMHQHVASWPIFTGKIRETYDAMQEEKATRISEEHAHTTKPALSLVCGRESHFDEEHNCPARKHVHGEHTRPARSSSFSNAGGIKYSSGVPTHLDKKIIALEEKLEGFKGTQQERTKLVREMKRLKRRVRRHAEAKRAKADKLRKAKRDFIIGSQPMYDNRHSPERDFKTRNGATGKDAYLNAMQAFGKDKDTEKLMKLYADKSRLKRALKKK